MDEFNQLAMAVEIAQLKQQVFALTVAIIILAVAVGMAAFYALLTFGKERRGK